MIVLLVSSTVNAEYSEIHCKHFFHGYPKGSPSTNDLIIRDIYAMSTNDKTKFADWVAYRLDRSTVIADVKTTRVWHVDPWLDENETLEKDDYTNAYAQLHTDRGHQAPLASFKGTNSWSDTNYLSNITPQSSALNQGAWKALEKHARDLAKKRTIYVLTGPLYERSMPSLPSADESHKIPSGYWKIIIYQTTKKLDSIITEAYILDQNISKTADYRNFTVSIDEIEQRSKLNFLSELPDQLEKKIEAKNE